MRLDHLLSKEEEVESGVYCLVIKEVTQTNENRKSSLLEFSRAFVCRNSKRMRDRAAKQRVSREATGSRMILRADK